MIVVFVGVCLEEFLYVPMLIGVYLFNLVG